MNANKKAPYTPLKVSKKVIKEALITEQPKRGVLYELLMLEAVKIGKSEITGAMEVSGVFQKSDEPNANRRVYPSEYLNREFKRLKEACKARSLFGELDHPWFPDEGEAAIVHAKETSHIITDLWNEGSIYYGKLELLDTPNGLIAQEIISKKCQIGVSSRSLGGVRQGANGFSYVDDTLKILTWDIVIGPSVVESKLQEVRALKEWQELSASILKEQDSQAKDDIRKDIRTIIRDQILG